MQRNIELTLAMKYMGSKAKIAEDIIPIMLKGRTKGQYFIDLFCGGCNLLDKVDGNRIGNDLNPYLIAMWFGIQKGYNYPTYIPKELYSIWRDFYNRTKKSVPDFTNPTILDNYGLCGWVGFMGSFNGRFYDGGYSGHNVIGKTGKSRDYIAEQISNTLSQQNSLKGVEFVCSSYDKVKLPANSIIYCDIPYAQTKQYDLSKNFDYNKFYNWCHRIAEQGHKVFISEYNMPIGFECVWSKEVTNSLNQMITKKPIEKLFIPI